MEAIIVIGHGEFAGGLSKALELIMGKQEDYYFIDYNQDCNAGYLRHKLGELLKGLKGKIYICCDLLNGTPFNISLEYALNNDNITLLYGINLPTLLQMISQRMFENGEIDAEKAISTGQENMGILDKSIFSAE